jgi:hypothetical protein
MQTFIKFLGVLVLLCVLGLVSVLALVAQTLVFQALTLALVLFVVCSLVWFLVQDPATI